MQYYRLWDTAIEYFVISFDHRVSQLLKISAVKDVFVVAAKRTPFGAFGGNLKNYTPTDLMEFAGRAALQASNINPEIIDIVNIGHVHTVSRNFFLMINVSAHYV